MASDLNALRNSDTLQLLGGALTVGATLESLSGATDLAGSPQYWAAHPEAWPINYMVLGDQAYTKKQAITVLEKPATNDLTYLVAQTLIAAKLNLRLTTGYPESLLLTIHDADKWLAANPIGSGVTLSSLQWQEVQPLYVVLAQFNSGIADTQAQNDLFAEVIS